MKNIFGYIEGYYGKILTWENRKVIVDRLNVNKMNSYFYAPKSDIFHRQNWQKNYPSVWYKDFNSFCKYANSKGIMVIAGISPGLTFNFNSNVSIEKSDDFVYLKSKAKKLLYYGANKISLLMDDIPNKFSDINRLQEGESHALLANILSQHIKDSIFFVPRIYADELKPSSKFYLSQLSKKINPEIILFYSGRNIVSKTISKNKKSIYFKFENNRIVIWDNLYANDYCPRRLFVGPWLNRDSIKDIMINGTGMIYTDLLILDIVGKYRSNKLKKNILSDVFKQNNIPKQFLKVSKYFYLPDFGSNPKLKNIKFHPKDIVYIDYLLWEWSNHLSREWYSFLMGMKHDLLISKEKFEVERIIKTQNFPLARKIIKNKL